MKDHDKTLLEPLSSQVMQLKHQIKEEEKEKSKFEYKAQQIIRMQDR
jgi:hypothetical protein